MEYLRGSQAIHAANLYNIDGSADNLQRLENAIDRGYDDSKKSGYKSFEHSSLGLNIHWLSACS